MPIGEVDPQAQAITIASADGILEGHWVTLGVGRDDLVAPAWRSDRIDTPPVDLDGRRPTQQSLKVIWELSRHHVLTVLAAAAWLTNEDRYAARAAELLRSWLVDQLDPRDPGDWSGVEVAERLISWAWLYRLAGGNDSVCGVMDSPPFQQAVRSHLDWLQRFPSRFSSANNHALAEAAGLVVGACAFGHLAHERGLGQIGLDRLVEQIDLQIDDFGLQREAAIDYHCFVFDLGVTALAEAHAADLVVPKRTTDALARMHRALGAIVDDDLFAPRIGDSDESEVAQMDGAGLSPAIRSLSLGVACIAPVEGRTVPATVRGALVGGLADGLFTSTGFDRTARVGGEATNDPGGYVAVLRSAFGEQPRMWAALRSGQFSYRTIGSHSHADLLSLQIRLDGLDLVVDPGTYVYDALPEWRRVFRSTASHSTLEVDGQDQVEYWGGFLWGGDAAAELTGCRRDDDGAVSGWSFSHNGYQRLPTPTRVSRSVDRSDHALTVVDTLDRNQPANVRLVWRLGPECTIGRFEKPTSIAVALGGRSVTWDLPTQLTWAVVNPGSLPYGMISRTFGSLTPAPTLVGTGSVEGGSPMTTTIRWR